MADDLIAGMTPLPEKSLDLFDVLKQLPLITDHTYLQMQALNIAITDLSLKQMEQNLFELYNQGDGTPAEQALFLNAWSQMWVFAFFELMRTWKVGAKDFLNFSRKLLEGNAQAQAQHIQNKTAALKKAARLTIDRGIIFHFKPLQWVVEDPASAETTLDRALKSTSSLRRMLNDVRSGLAKHQIQNSSTIAPTSRCCSTHQPALKARSGTGSSNRSPSSMESGANLWRRYTVRIQPRPLTGWKSERPVFVRNSGAQVGPFWISASGRGAVSFRKGTDASNPADRVSQLMRRACRLFPHHSDQIAYLAAVALDNRGEFGALGDRHADPLDNKIIDLVSAVVVDQPPIDSEGRCAARADHVA